MLRAYAGRDRGTQAAVHGLGAFRTGLDFFETNENRIGENRTDAWGFSANIALELSDTLSLTSITSYDGGKQDLQQAADGAPIDDGAPVVVAKGRGELAPLGLSD